MCGTGRKRHEQANANVEVGYFTESTNKVPGADQDCCFYLRRHTGRCQIRQASEWLLQLECGGLGIMFDHMKYIVTEVSCCNIFMMFDPILEHAQMSRGNVLGAGTVDLVPEDGKIVAYCYGKSVSLGVASRGEEDSKIITKALNRNID